MYVNMHFYNVLRAVFDDCQLCPTSQSQGISVIKMHKRQQLHQWGWTCYKKTLDWSLSYFLLNWKAQATTTATTTKTSLETCCYSTSLVLSNVVVAGGFFQRIVTKIRKRKRKSLSRFHVLLKRWNKEVSRRSRPTTAKKYTIKLWCTCKVVELII